MLYTLYLLAAKVVGTSMDPLVVSSIHPHEFLFLVPTGETISYSQITNCFQEDLCSLGLLVSLGQGNDKESFNQQIK